MSSTAQAAPQVAPQVDFYILADSATAAKSIYACRIADKAFGQGMKVYLRTDTAAECEKLNELLWSFSQGSFVPHAIYDPKNPPATDKYPVQIGIAPAPPECEVLISLSESAPPDFAQFSRIAELVANHADDKKHARNRFRFYRQAGIEPNSHDIK